MPLPEDNPVWPPQECKDAEKHYREWGAWYSGDSQQLRSYYQVTNGMGALIDTKYPDSASNLLSQTSRFFWGNPPDPGSVRDAKLHVPLAGDIASTSADLLFGEPPVWSVPESADNAEATQARLDKIIENGLIPVLLEAAEVDSALGGVYLRVVIDQKMSDTVLFDTIPPEAAVPEWRSGRLEAATFWRQIDQDEGKVYRHLERHEVGWIYHGLFAGTDDHLGDPVDLRIHPDTEGFAALVDRQGRMATGADTLTAEYVPNMRPNRLMRGSPLGRSDYQGIELVMDALDETWSSLMRDIHLGKSRLVVPESYLDSQGAGRGARFNAERELFLPVKAMPDNEGISLQSIQFDIRVDQHLTTCRNLAVQGLRGAGYSAQTFGEGDQGGPATATEIQARERRSFVTRDRKIGYWRPPLARLTKAALQVDKLHYGSDSGDVSELPNIEWPDGVQVDIQTTSQVVQMLDAAGAVSLRTKVTMVHPQWDADQIEEEMEAIKEAATPEVDTDPNAGTLDTAPEPPADEPAEPEPIEAGS